MAPEGYMTVTINDEVAAKLTRVIYPVAIHLISG